MNLTKTTNDWIHVSAGKQVRPLHDAHVDVGHAALHVCHGTDDGDEGGLVAPFEAFSRSDAAAFAHGGDVGNGGVAVLGRCPPVDDFLERVEVVQGDVRVQDAEGSAEAEEVALELHKLAVMLWAELPEPPCAVTPAYVQWVVVSLSSCHSGR